MAADALTVCPKELCPKRTWGKGKVKKMISAGAGLIFKGSGFYITDYRSDKYKEAAKQDTSASSGSTSAASAAESKTSKPAAGGADSKPAAKAETKKAKPAKAGD